MSVINITDISILNNPGHFTDPYTFKITFECISELSEDIEWKLIYVGSAENESFDQELDTCMVGPVPVGVNSFEFEAAAPTPSQIPASDLIGVTVVLLTGSYLEQEFVTIGYYVHTDYESEEMRALPEDQRPNWEAICHYHGIAARPQLITNDVTTAPANNSKASVPSKLHFRDGLLLPASPRTPAPQKCLRMGRCSREGVHPCPLSL